MNHAIHNAIVSFIWGIDFDYFFRSASYRWELRVRSKGIWRSRYQLTADAFMTMPVIIPSENEQKQIVRFLNYKCTQIAKFIRNKRRLIELLTEQKQAIINQVVTRGIDPNVRLKPSGVDYLGDIPEHWEVRRLKIVSKIIMGQSPDSNECNVEGSGRPFLQGCAEFGDIHPKPIQFCSTAAKVAPVKSLFISVRAPVGNLNLADQEYSIGRGLCAIILHNSLLDMNFALQSIKILKSQLLALATGSTYDAVSVGEIGNMKIFLPPINEQYQIVDYIDQKNKSIEIAINRDQKEIDLIREYRTRLIADVVTGKVDVRGIAVESVPEDESMEGLIESGEMEEKLDIEEDQDEEI